MPITELDIQKLANTKSYKKGKDYFKSNAVTDIQKRGNRLLAEVEGSNYEPYQVNVELSKDSIVSTYCDCPYDGDGVCKHIVAVLLNYIHNPESIDELPTIEELLVNLNESDLREILIDLLESEPRFIDQVQSKINTLSISKLQKESAASKIQDNPTPSKQHIPIDTASFKRQAKQIFKNTNRRDYYDNHYDDDYDSGIADEFTELFQNAKPLIDAGDAGNALAILDTVMDVFVDSWSDEEYYDDIGDMLDIASSLFTEAILSPEFSEKEQQKWKKKFSKWQKKLSDGSSDGFALPVAALEQGWDYPPLKAVLKGKTAETGAWELDEDGEYPEYAYDLNIIRLRVLERQGRNQEYLYFAEAEGLTEQYATMLVKLDRCEDAIEYVFKHGLYSEEAVKFATALYDKGLVDDALKIAEHCMQITENYINQQEKTYFSHNGILLLTRWLRDNAQKQSNLELALKGAKTAFKYSVSLDDYLAIKSIATANGDWETFKSKLLADLKKNEPGKNYGLEHNKVKIYLHEKMHKEATEVVDNSSGWWDYSTIEPVVDAVYKEFPDWAIKKCIKQAEPNMDDGKSKYYEHSVRWVKKAGKIYIEANRRKEWNEYLEGLIKKHQKKYSLRPQLEALRKL